MAPSLSTKGDRIELMRAYLTPPGMLPIFQLRVSKLQMFRPRNLLFGVCLHAAARLSNGTYLSVFEKRVLAMVKSIGAEDDEIKEYGQMYTEFHESQANEEVKILPDDVARRPLENEYTDEDFLRDVKALTKDIVAMDGSRVVDIAKMSKDNDDNAADNNAFGVTVFTGPAVTDRDATHAMRNDCKLVLSKFKVHSRPTVGRGETYWLTAVGSDVRMKQLPDRSQQLALAFDQSPVFKAITKGQELSFKSEQVLYNGKVDKRLACHVLCWEADNSSEDFYAVVRQTLREEAEQLIEAAVTAAGADDAWDSTEALLALVATVTGFENALLGLASYGDEVMYWTDRSVAFTAEGLAALLNRPGNQVALYFDNTQARGGRNELYIKRVANLAAPGALHYTTFDGAWTLPDPAGNGTAAAATGMSVAESGATGLGVGIAPDRSIYYSIRKDGNWSPAECVQGQYSTNLPSVAALKGKFFCVYRGLGNEIWCTSVDATMQAPAEEEDTADTPPNPIAFLGPQKPNLWSQAINAGQPSGRTADAPAVVAFNDRLICVLRGENNRIYWSESSDGSTWSERYNIFPNGLTSGLPSLAVLNDELYAFIRGTDNVLYWSKRTSNGTSWSSSWTRVGSVSIPSSPAAATLGNQIVCTFRGASDSLNFLTFDGSGWNAPAPVGGQRCLGDQGLGVLDSQLYCFYGAS